MFDPKALFQERLREHLKRLNRYLRYIFNGHFMIALIFLLVTLSVYYQQMIERITNPTIPTIIIAFVFGMIVSYNPLQFFLKEPDKVFIIVKESKMKPYFKRSFIYNYVFQLYLLFFTVVAIGPLYTHLYPEKGLKHYSILIFISLLLKFSQMWMNWLGLRTHHLRLRNMDKVIRLLFIMFFFYVYLHDVLLSLVVIVGYIIYSVYRWKKIATMPGLAWDVLIENDEHRLAQFYRFVNMFADAPQLKQRMKRRKILSHFIEKQIRFKQEDIYNYLFRITFIRSSDYLHMYIRLIVIGILFIIFIPNGWLKIVFGLLFTYMAIFQIIPLYAHHRTNIWLDIYPIQYIDKKEKYIRFSMTLTNVQTIVFSLTFLCLAYYTEALIMFFVGILFNHIFHSQYVEKRLSKM